MMACFCPESLVALHHSPAYLCCQSHPRLPHPHESGVGNDVERGSYTAWRHAGLLSVGVDAVEELEARS